MLIRLASSVALMLGLVPHAKAGWIHDVRAPSGALPATSSLRYDTASYVGTPNLDDALLALTDAGSAELDILVLHERLLEADFQQQLFLRCGPRRHRSLMMRSGLPAITTIPRCWRCSAHSCRQFRIRA